MHDVIIIGAGPAGLTAAIYTARARLKTAVFENPKLAPQAAYAYIIENYPGFPKGVNGAELVDNFKHQAKKYGAEFISAAVSGITFSKKDNRDVFRVSSDGKLYESLSVIIASGASAKKLGVAGEEQFSGKGVSYCATCDGAFFKNKDIAVAGGGNSAIEEAIFLTRFAKKVMIVHRRDRLRASKILQEEALANKKIEVIWSSVITEIKGSRKVELLKVKDVLSGKEKDIPCEGLFISVGAIPNTDFAKDKVKLDEQGYVVADSQMKTSRQGIFACGDCRNTPLRQIATACGDGAIAAVSSQQYIDELRGTLYK